MLTIITLDKPVLHRDTRIIKHVYMENSYRYDGFDRAVAFLEQDDKWWLIPNDWLDDNVCTDVGPYDTPEEALLMLRLSFEIT